MNQKIILEIVPWVDNKLSRGWNLENRKKIISQCKTSDLVKNLPNSDDFCVCILEKLQKEYKFQEFEKLLAIEKSKILNDLGNNCKTETGTATAIYDNLRQKALSYTDKGNRTEAISNFLTIINDNKATAVDYSNIGINYIYTRQFDKAIKYLKEGEKMDNAELLVKINLAHAYLLNNDYKSAKQLHNKYKLQNVTALQSWKNRTKEDFLNFKKAGIQNNNFDRILKSIED